MPLCSVNEKRIPSNSSGDVCSVMISQPWQKSHTCLSKYRFYSFSLWSKSWLTAMLSAFFCDFFYQQNLYWCWFAAISHIATSKCLRHWDNTTDLPAAVKKNVARIPPISVLSQPLNGVLLSWFEKIKDTWPYVATALGWKFYWQNQFRPRFYLMSWNFTTLPCNCCFGLSILNNMMAFILDFFSDGARHNDFVCFL